MSELKKLIQPIQSDPNGRVSGQQIALFFAKPILLKLASKQGKDSALYKKVAELYGRDEGIKPAPDSSR